MFLLTQPLGGLGVIAEPRDFVRVSNVNVVLVKHDSERLILAIHKYLPLLRFSGVLRVAHYHDFVGTRIRQKNVPIRGNRQPAGILEICCENIHHKSLRHGGQESCRWLLYLGWVSRRLGQKWRWQLRLLAVRNLSWRQ